MDNITVYRNNGAIGALLDIYEKSIDELITEIKGISHNQLIEVVDPYTNDENCRSVQTILTHIVNSGYIYVLEIRKWLGEEIRYKDKVLLNEIGEYQTALNRMFEFHEKLFEDYPNLILLESDSNKKINVRWGQQYDVEQLLEHAIVHILRHRRQIGRFKHKMKERP